MAPRNLKLGTRWKFFHSPPVLTPKCTIVSVSASFSQRWLYNTTVTIFLRKTSVKIRLTTSPVGPYLEEDLVVANPAGDHVGSWHLPIPREAEPDISQRTHLNFKCDIFCAGSPEDCVVGIEIYWVGPMGAGNMPQPYSDSEQHSPDPNHGNLSSRHTADTQSPATSSVRPHFSLKHVNFVNEVTSWTVYLTVQMVKGWHTFKNHTIALRIRGHSLQRPQCSMQYIISVNRVTLGTMRITVSTIR